MDSAGAFFIALQNPPAFLHGASAGTIVSLEKLTEIWRELEPWSGGRYPMLPYPGSKGRLAPEIVRFLPRTGRCYVEPCVGRANVFWVAGSELHYRYWWLNDTRTAPFLEAVRTHGDRVIVPEFSREQYEKHWELAVISGKPESLLLAPHLCYGGAEFLGSTFKNVKEPYRISPQAYADTLKRCCGIVRDKNPWITQCEWWQLGLDRLGPDDTVYLDPPYPSCNLEPWYSDSDIDYEFFIRVLKRARYRWLLSGYHYPPYIRAFGEPFYIRQMRKALPAFKTYRTTTECLWRNY